MNERIRRAVPTGLRHRYGVARYWLGRASGPLRKGVNPVDWIAHERSGRLRLRFKGVEVSSDNPKLAWTLAYDIFEEAEYDYPGFIPQPGWKVVDLGANIGLFSMLAASRGAQVTSYEPHPDLCAHARTNTQKWGVQCHQAAVTGAASGTVALHVNAGRDIRNTLRATDSGGDALSESIEVPSVQIADVLSDGCDLLKIDIEGGEFELLENGGPALGRAKRVIAEIHREAGDPAAAVEALESAGFAVTLHEGLHEQPLLTLTATR